LADRGLGEGRSVWVNVIVIKETPRRRITVTSSLNEIATEQMGNRMVVRGVGVTPGYSARSQPFLQQASGQVYKDDVTGFSSFLNICFMVIMYM
jgi:hypothetical protein